MYGRMGGSVAGWFLQGSMVWLLAPVTELLFPAGLRRPGARGRVYAHTAYRNTRSRECGW